MSELADGPAAPESLSVRFANTRYAVRGRPHDGIETPELLSNWLAGHADALGLAGAAPAVDDTDVRTFAALREAIRELIADTVGAPDSFRHPTAGDGVALLNRLSAGAPSWPALLRAGDQFQVVERTARDARTAALATLAQDAIKLLGGELRADLRACLAPGCVQYFIKDHPRREWCSPACGNRARAARHYLRHRDD
jgi:predicted RNA-binding Zn ribbon-like protein